MKMDAPGPDPETQRQQRAARAERVRTVQEDLASETENLQRIFGQRGVTGSARRPSISGVTRG
jgi:hypothetical protein